MFLIFLVVFVIILCGKINILIVTTSVLFFFILSCIRRYYFIRNCKSNARLLSSDIYVIPFEHIKYKGAFAVNNYVIFEESFYDEQDDVSKNVIISHERYHLKHRHTEKKNFFRCVLLWNSLHLMFGQNGLYKLILLLVLCAIYIVLISYFEYNADGYSVENNGIDDVIYTLEHLEQNNENIKKGDSICLWLNTIPSLKSRIRRLHKQKLQYSAINIKK